MDRKPLEKLKAVPKFDPSKSYQWDPKDLFTISGAELDAWYKGLSVMAATPEFQRFVHLQRALLTMNDFIKDAAEQDLILPIEEVKTEQVEQKEDDGSIEQIV